MIEITGIAMGLTMTAVAVVLGGLTLQATLAIMGRALRASLLAVSLEPVPSI